MSSGAMGLLILASVLLTCTSAAAQNPGILDTLGVSRTFERFSQLLQDATLIAELKDLAGKSAVTIFAPRTNYLDFNVDPRILNFLKQPENIEDFKKILRFHVVAQGIPLSSLENAPSTNVTSYSGEELHIYFRRRLLIEIQTPIKLPNAIVEGSSYVHGIDGLLIPPSIYTKLVAAGVIATADSPSAAPAQPPPPDPFSFLAPGASPFTKPASGKSLTQLISNSTTSQKLASLLKSAGLADSLSNLRGNITFLVPSDAAFQALGTDGRQPAVSMAELEKPENKDLLQAVLQAHVLPNTYTAESLRSSAPATLQTLEDSELRSSLGTDGKTVLTSDGNYSANVVGTGTSSGGMSTVNIDGVLVPARVTTSLATKAASPDAPPAGPGSLSNITTVEAALGYHKYLSMARAVASGSSTLANYTGDVTVLAPSDFAFMNLPDPIKAQLEDPSVMGKLVDYHSLRGFYDIPLLRTSAPFLADTLLGTKVAVSASPTGTVTFNNGISNATEDLEEPRLPNRHVIAVSDVLLPPDLAAIAAAASAFPPSQGDNVFEGISSASHGALFRALNGSGVEEQLRTLRGPVTLLAPTDAAFEALPAEISSNPAALNKVLLYHALLGNYPIFDLKNKGEGQPFSIPTATGENVTFEYAAKTLNFTGLGAGGSGTVTKQISTSATGTVLEIDRILLPPSLAVGGGATSGPFGSSSGAAALNSLQKSGNFSALLSALNSSGLVQSIVNSTEPLTLLAPDDKAFQNAPADVQAALQDPSTAKGLLRHHVLPGSVTAQFLEASAPSKLTTLAGDQISTSRGLDGVLLDGKTKLLSSPGAGVIGIDSVLAPQTLGAAAPAPLGSLLGEQTLDALSRTGQYTKLLTGLQDTGLRETIANGRNITLLAPTDTAFKNAGQDINTLSSEQARNLLLNHVVRGGLSDQGWPPSSLTALNGANVSASRGTDGVLLFGGKAKSLGAVGPTSIGIDQVLVPSTMAGVLAPAGSPLGAPGPAGTSFNNLASLLGQNYTTLLDVMVGTGADDIFGSYSGPLTLLAPNNEAFQRLSPEEQRILRDPIEGREVMLYHAVKGLHSKASLTGAPVPSLETLAGEGSLVIVTPAAGDTVIFNNKSTALDGSGGSSLNRNIIPVDQVLFPLFPMAPAMSPGEALAPPVYGKQLLRTLGDGSHSEFLKALMVSGLDTQLADVRAPITLLAPTNAAFEKLPSGVKSALSQNSPLLHQTLLYHMTDGVKTLDGLNTIINVNGGPLSIPMFASEDVSVSVDPRGGLAFNGGAEGAANATKQFHNDSSASIIDTDAVLIPPSLRTYLSSLASGAPVAAAGPSSSALVADQQGVIIEALARNGNYSVLLKSLNETDLLQAIENKIGSMTLLAPTNEAFEAAPDTVKAALNEPDVLRNILRYHLVPEDLNLGLLKAAAPEDLGTIVGDMKIRTGMDADTVVFNDNAKVVEVVRPGAIGIDNVLVPKDLQSLISEVPGAPFGQESGKDDGGPEKKKKRCGKVCAGLLAGLLGPLGIVACCVCCFALFACCKKRRQREKEIPIMAQTM